MAIDVSIPRTRRALLAGGIGGLAAVVASALGRPLPAMAGTDGDVVLGKANTATTTTAISNFTTTNTAFAANCSSGHALTGTTSGPNKAGVYGVNNAAGGIGVHGNNTTGTGVLGWGETGVEGRSSSKSGTGVRGENLADGGPSRGVYGYALSSHGTGVLGRTTHPTGSTIAVWGVDDSSAGVGVYGHSLGHATGVLGYSGSDFPGPGPVAKTGVYGYAAQDSGSRGVTGQSTAGRGVSGQATSGVGTYGYSTSGTGGSFATSTGYALRTSGRVRIDKASGVATIEAGNSVETVTPGIDVTSTSFVLLTPKADLGTRRLWYTTNATANTFTIRVSSAVPANLQVGWLLLG